MAYFTRNTSNILPKVRTLSHKLHHQLTQLRTGSLIYLKQYQGYCTSLHYVYRNNPAKLSKFIFIQIIVWNTSNYNLISITAPILRETNYTVSTEIYKTSLISIYGTC